MHTEPRYSSSHTACMAGYVPHTEFDGAPEDMERLHTKHGNILPLELAWQVAHYEHSLPKAITHQSDLELYL